MKQRKLQRKINKSHLHILWAKQVKDRDGWRCQLCGKNCGKLGGHAHAHHIMRKQSTFMRYNIENGITLCAGCHKFGVHSPDGEVAFECLQRLIHKIGSERWDRLRAWKQNPPKMKLFEAIEQFGLTDNGDET